METIIEKYKCEIELIKEKIKNIENLLENNPTDNNLLKQILKLKEELDDKIQKEKYFKNLLELDNKDRYIPSSIGTNENTENENREFLKLKIKELEKKLKEFEEKEKNIPLSIGTNENTEDKNIESLKLIINELEKNLKEYEEQFSKNKNKEFDEKEKYLLLKKRLNNLNKEDSNEIEEIKKTMQEYEKEILKSKNRESHQKNKNQFIRKILEDQQKRLNTLLIQLSLEKTKSSSNLIKLLQNIILILQQFSEVSKNRNNTKYYTNVQRILEQLKTDSIKTLKEIEIQKLNKNSSNYNKIINQLKEIMKSMLSYIN